MQWIKTLKETYKITSTKMKVITSTALVMLVASSAAVFAGWTPNRPVYNWNIPADRVGSMNGPRMNAFINTPQYGDERAFFDACSGNQTACQQNNGGSFKDVLANPTNSRFVTLRTYIHNGANQSTNSSGVGKTAGAKVRVVVPSGLDASQRVTSHISINNPAPGYPGTVSDTTDLVDSKKFAVKYVPGSAKIYTERLNGTTLSDDIVSGGATIGYDGLDGRFPGCFEYQAIVVITVEIQVAEQRLDKVVRKTGDTDYSEITTVKPGDKVEWRLTWQNMGSMAQDNVVVTDVLPAHLTVVPGSVKWIYRATDGSVQEVVQSDTGLFTNYVNFGRWAPNGGFNLKFDTTAKDDFTGCEVTVRNVARSHSQQLTNDLINDASVKIVKENCNVQPPAFSCVSLSSNKINRTTFDLTAVGSVTNTTITSYLFKVGGTEVQNTSSPNYQFVQTTPGTYTITVQIVTPLGTTPVSAACSQTVTVEPEPTNPVFSCDALDVVKLSRTNFQFGVTGSASGGATITGYIFNLNGVEKQNGTSNTYNLVQETPGTYTVTAQVKTSHGTTPVSAICTEQITVDQPPVTPAYSCDLLEVKLISGRKYSFTTKFTADNASAKRFFYTFGDGTAELITDKSSVEHTYAAAGDYAAKVKIEFEVNGELKMAESDKCRAVFNSPETPVTPIRPVSVKLPNTGAGDVAGLFVAVTLVAGLLRRYTLSRLF